MPPLGLSSEFTGRFNPINIGAIIGIMLGIVVGVNLLTPINDTILTVTTPTYGASVVSMAGLIPLLFIVVILLLVLAAAGFKT